MNHYMTAVALVGTPVAVWGLTKLIAIAWFATKRKHIERLMKEVDHGE